jgi:hypothetical protein
MFPIPKPHPQPALGNWIGFEVQGDAEIDLDAAQVRGYQGPFRAMPADPTQPAFRDWSEAFVVELTRASDVVNPYPTGDVGAIRAVLDGEIARLALEPRRTFSVQLGGGGIGVTFDPMTVQPSDLAIQQIMGVVLARAKAQDVMGVYDDPAWPAGSAITMTVNGVPV